MYTGFAAWNNRGNLQPARVRPPLTLSIPCSTRWRAAPLSSGRPPQSQEVEVRAPASLPLPHLGRVRLACRLPVACECLLQRLPAGQLASVEYEPDRAQPMPPGSRVRRCEPPCLTAGSGTTA